MGSKNRKTPSLLAIAVLALAGATCASAEAADGGTAPESTTSTSAEKPEASVESDGLSVTATQETEAVVSGGAITLRSRSAATRGQAIAFTGTAPTASAGETAVIERYVKASASWDPMAAAQVEPSGAFLAHWQASVTGLITVRTTIFTESQLAATRSPTSTGGVNSSAASPQEVEPSNTVSGSAQITIFKPALATFYGPGLYGHHTACGQLLTRSLVGVASRKLPCGTLVAVSYDHERLTLPVVDRGPYGDAAKWDLTAGAATALGMTTSAQIGTLVVGKVANTPALGAPPAGTTPEVAATGGAPANETPAG